MPKIRSNKSLKYDPVKPQLEGIIQLEIIEVKDYLEQELTVVTVRDSIVTENEIDGEIVEHFQPLNTRNKTFTFADIDALEQALASEITVNEPYMARRKKLLEVGLLFITQNDEYPLYFSSGQDWEIVG